MGMFSFGGKKKSKARDKKKEKGGDKDKEAALGYDEEDGYGEEIYDEGALELLADDAIKIITRNADKVLTYAGTYTFGKAAAEGAMTLAFSGLLRDESKEAGEGAVASCGGRDKFRSRLGTTAVGRSLRATSSGHHFEVRASCPSELDPSSFLLTGAGYERRDDVLTNRDASPGAPLDRRGASTRARPSHRGFAIVALEEGSLRRRRARDGGQGGGREPRSAGRVLRGQGFGGDAAGKGGGGGLRGAQRGGKGGG